MVILGIYVRFLGCMFAFGVGMVITEGTTEDKETKKLRNKINTKQTNKQTIKQTDGSVLHETTPVFSSDWLLVFGGVAHLPHSSPRLWLEPSALAPLVTIRSVPATFRNSGPGGSEKCHTVVHHGWLNNPSQELRLYTCCLYWVAPPFLFFENP